MSYRTVTLSNGDTVAITESIMRGTGPQGVPGGPGPAGSATTIRGYYNTYSALVAAIPVGQQGEAYVVLDTGKLWSWDTMRATPAWVDCGKIVGPAAVTSIGAQRSRNSAKNLTAAQDWVVDYAVAADWNDLDPAGGKVLDEAQMTATNTAVDNDLSAYYIVVTTLAFDTAVTAQTYTIHWKTLTAQVDGLSTEWTDGKKQRTVVHTAVLKTSSSQVWQLHISPDVNAVVLSVKTEWSRIGGAAGPQGVKGSPPTMITGATTTLAAGASATSSVVEDPAGSSIYKINFGIPQGIQGAPGGGYTNFDLLAGTTGGASESSPGASPPVDTDASDLGIPTPSYEQKPYIPYFFRLLVSNISRKLVSPLTTAQKNLRGAPLNGEVVYDTDLKRFQGGQRGISSPTTAWYQIPTIEYGTSGATHGQGTDRPNGSLFFKYD